MKVFIGIDDDNPIVRSITAICKLSHTIITDGDEADLIIVTNAKDALRNLKEYEETKILIMLLPINGARDEAGARSLATTYPERIIVRPTMPRQGEQGATVFIMQFNGEAA